MSSPSVESGEQFPRVDAHHVFRRPHQLDANPAALPCFLSP
ncbi:MAG: hypothetical protein ABSG32_29235 [Terriglobia bacterium]|jgi:hypothetical protein